MKKLLFLILFILLIGCSDGELKDGSEIPEQLDVEGSELNEVEDKPMEKSEDAEITNTTKPECTQDTDCTGLERCIDNSCGLLKEINQAECDAKCTLKSATMETSDGKVLTLKRGESTYTAAGALAWKLLNPGEYCEDSNVKIPVEFEKVNYGKVLSTQVVTTTVGEVSEEITHPTVKRVKFTLKITDLVEECN